MNSGFDSVLKVLELARGLEIDLDEGWRKVIARQFSGSAGRGFCELIQNFLDSYPSTVPFRERRAVIETCGRMITITDYGEGMDRKRLELLLTLGGTDKRNDPSKIGTFGIGFFSIFNPALGTVRVTVTTRCEGRVVRLIYHVRDPQKRPEITTEVLDEAIDYSTRIEVHFDRDGSPERCLKHAERHLRYYPCRVTVNGRAFRSVWESAPDDALHFSEGSCDGFIVDSCSWREVILLRKYERIMTITLDQLVTGGRGMRFDLRDLERKGVPHVPEVEITVNSDRLSVPISRDGFYLDGAYHELVRVTAGALMELLEWRLTRRMDRGLVIANQYVLHKRLKKYLQQRQEGSEIEDSPQNRLLKLLAEARVYRLSGRRQRRSLLELISKRTAELPLFYAPRQSNLRWLGGAFKHDFIVLPSRCDVGRGAPGLYDKLFKEIIGDVVNLDTIKNDPSKLAELVERGIVEAEALAPKTKIRHELSVGEDELKLLKEINGLLRRRAIRAVIAETLRLPVRALRATYFDVEAEGINVATGMFDAGGAVLTDLPDPERRRDYLLGICLGDQYVQHLIASDDPFRAHYALTFLGHQLTACQEQLVPHTRFFNFVRRVLCQKLRRALVEILLPRRVHAQLEGAAP